MNHYNEIEKLMKGKSAMDKIVFCRQCLEEPLKYTPERIFALKEYLQNVRKEVNDVILGGSE